MLRPWRLLEAVQGGVRRKHLDRDRKATATMPHICSSQVLDTHKDSVSAFELTQIQIASLAEQFRAFETTSPHSSLQTRHVEWRILSVAHKYPAGKTHVVLRFDFYSGRFPDKI